MHRPDVRGREFVKPILEFEVQKFNQVMDQWLGMTSRKAADAVNSRMAFLLMRIFAILPPHNLKEERRRIRQYMNQPRGDTHKDVLIMFTAAGRLVAYKSQRKRKVGERPRLKHLIVQKKQRQKGRKGLYGQEMRAAAEKLMRRSVSSVGYLKSGLIKAIRKFNGHFTQLGGQKRKDGQGKVSANQAFVKMLQEYGHSASGGNVGVHGGSKTTARLAKPTKTGLKEALASIDMQVAPDQLARVQLVYRQAASMAFRDERAEMELVIQRKLEEAASEAYEREMRPSNRVGADTVGS